MLIALQWRWSERNYLEHGGHLLNGLPLGHPWHPGQCVFVDALLYDEACKFGIVQGTRLYAVDDDIVNVLRCGRNGLWHRLYRTRDIHALHGLVHGTNHLPGYGGAHAELHKPIYGEEILFVHFVCIC